MKFQQIIACNVIIYIPIKNYNFNGNKSTTQKCHHIVLSVSSFFADFCLHGNWRTPVPIISKFMPVIKIHIIIHHDLKRLREGDCLSNIERHNEWWS